jgi:hypothetical protein
VHHLVFRRILILHALNLFRQNLAFALNSYILSRLLNVIQKVQILLRLLIVRPVDRLAIVADCSLVVSVDEKGVVPEDQL